MKERRKILEEQIKSIPGRVMLSEQTLIKVFKKIDELTFLKLENQLLTRIMRV